MDGWFVLDEVFALGDVHAVCNSTQVHSAQVSTYFTADAAGTELVWHWSLRLKGELNAAALAASFEFPVVRSVSGLMLMCDKVLAIQPHLHGHDLG
jgi:hypothetical protein